MRSIGVPAVLGLAMSLLAPSPATAWGTVGVVVRAPHATVAFSAGSPFFPVGCVVPPLYASHVFYRPWYGYGFWAPPIYGVRHAHFVPMRHHGRSWVVAPWHGRQGWHR